MGIRIIVAKESTNNLTGILITGMQNSNLDMEKFTAFYFFSLNIAKKKLYADVPDMRNFNLKTLFQLL
jgi:hypothetical protein